MIKNRSMKAAFIRVMLSFILGRRNIYFGLVRTFFMRVRKPRENGLKILFFPFGYFEEAFVWEAVMIKALQMRGHRCVSFLCESAVPACEMRAVDNDSEMLCASCQARSTIFFGLSSIDYLRSSRYLNGKDYEFIEKLIPREIDPIRNFKYEEIDFGSLVRISLFHHLRIGLDQDTSEFTNAYRKFVFSAMLLYFMFKKILNEEKPDIIIALNGLLYPWAVLKEIADKKGIRCITYENAYINERLIFSDDAAAIKFPTDEVWSKYKDLPLTDEEEKKLDNYFKDSMFGQGSSIQLWKDPDFDPGKFINKMGLKAYKKIFTLFTNILWDSSIIGCDEAFGNILEWFDETIAYFAADGKDCALVIRIHPAEIRIPNQESRQKAIDYLNHKYETLPKNITVIGPEDNTSSYMIMKESDCVLVNTSITGLEAACFGKPAIIVGKTHYKNKGFTMDAKDKRTYFNSINRIMNDDLKMGSKEIIEKARRYAHTFFFRYMIEFPFLKQKLHGVNRALLRIKSVDELKPGKNKSLDAVCSFILGEAKLW